MGLAAQTIEEIMPDGFDAERTWTLSSPEERSTVSHHEDGGADNGDDGGDDESGEPEPDLDSDAEAEAPDDTMDEPFAEL